MAQLYRDLVAWKKGMLLAREVYRATESFPRAERFGLQAQVRRSAVSIPSNIAEGYGRFADGELLRFLRISRGSLAELETQLILARELSYLEETDCKALLERCDEVGRILAGLIGSVARRVEKTGAAIK